MYVCVCSGITDKQIREAVSEGVSFAEMRNQLGLASQCGKCANLARQVFNESLSLDNDNDDLFYAAG